ncbi:MAG: hypothetical protein JNM51_05070 [Bacteroidia bacterium]|nr:hypothetical protein [Bacteroidia bacterium]
MNKIIFLILFGFNLTYGQNHKVTNEIDSITSKWDYKVYPDTQKLKIIDYYPAYALCGRVYMNAMAICFNIRGETIRVIETCPGPKEFKNGEIVFFYPNSIIPKDKNPHLVNIDGELNPALKRSSKVTITTYGQLKSQ